MHDELRSSTSLESGATTCPYCGSETGIERLPEPELGALSLDELETLVRNEWRRRLGPEAYGRQHSRLLIRSLIVFALEPESPVRRAAVAELLWSEIAILEAWGMSRAGIQAELRRLLEAVVDVLERVDLRVDLQWSLVEHIDGVVRQTLRWPDAADT
jgi:hypothetical protein